MKNTLVRAFVVALVLTGAVASSHIASASQPVLSGKLSAPPVPTCAPVGGETCGIGGGH